MRNSPYYHIRVQDVINVTFHSIDITVDVVAQKAIMSSPRPDGEPGWVNFQGTSLPTFPLNTDGIDPAGKDIYIYNVSIENFDDAVAVKPTSTNSGLYANCSENILVEDSTVSLGVGMTIGSVPPNVNVNCVRNVTFRNINFIDPFKAIYVKTNPGNTGTGIIEGITYENIHITRPIWWGIYIGPQQQKQPSGAGPGCMFYPIDPTCPTQPRITVRDITLRNVTSDSGILSPGIIRCNETNPCTGFLFENVQATGWLSDVGYICENVHGNVLNSNPAPTCF